MPTKILVRGEVAELLASSKRGRYWISTSAWLTQYLNAQLDPEGASGADPDPVYHEALRMANALNGKVIERDEKQAFVEDRVY